MSSVFAGAGREKYIHHSVWTYILWVVYYRKSKVYDRLPLM